MANYVYSVILFLSLLINVDYTLFTKEYGMGHIIPWVVRGTDFSKGIHCSLGNNVWGIGYSWGYSIHSDSGVTV